MSVTVGGGRWGSLLVDRKKQLVFSYTETCPLTITTTGNFACGSRSSVHVFSHTIITFKERGPFCIQSPNCFFPTSQLILAKLKNLYNQICNPLHGVLKSKTSAIGNFFQPFTSIFSQNDHLGTNIFASLTVCTFLRNNTLYWCRRRVREPGMLITLTDNGERPPPSKPYSDLPFRARVNERRDCRISWKFFISLSHIEVRIFLNSLSR